MLFRAWLPQILTALLGGLFITLGILAFGQPLYFDRLYIGILIFTALVCHKNINVVGIVIILLLERLVEETVWANAPTSFIENFVTYLCLSFIYFRLRYDPMAKLAVPCLLASVAAEIWWQVSSYQQAPQICWYNIIIAQGLLVRFLIFSRVEFTEQITGKLAQSIELDWFVHQVTRLYIAFNFLMVCEYLIRHLSHWYWLTYIYQLYSYAMHGIAIFTIFIVFQETNKLLQQRLLKA